MAQQLCEVCGAASGCLVCGSSLQSACESFNRWTRRRISYRAGRHIILEGDPLTKVQVLLSGWVLRSRCLENGGRQIVHILLPGDFLSTEVLRSDTATFDLVAKTDCVVAEWPLALFEELLCSQLDFARSFAVANALERAILAERLVSLGRRSAIQRTAHLLCELIGRLRMLHLSSGESGAVPLTQDDLADVLGLSKVHMNRTMRALHRQGVLTYGRGQIHVKQMSRLAEIAGQPVTYLDYVRADLPAFGLGIEPVQRPLHRTAVS